MKSFSEKIFALFFLLGIIFIPLEFFFGNIQKQITNFFFHKPITLFQNLFFDNALPNPDFSSDTISLNLLLVLLFVISIVLTFVLTKFKINTTKWVEIIRIVICYYLAFVLLKYGFDKVFKAQFYLPEPNILYEKFGNLSKDILYWSTIGTSRFYSVATGIIEVLVAVLLLFKRTRITGLFFSIGVFLHIVIINFGFDISVKTFSCFLFSASLFAFFPDLKTLISFLFFQKQEKLDLRNVTIIPNPFVKTGIKIFVIGWSFLQILFPYFTESNFNDDKAKRPFLHGAYQVKEIIPKDTLSEIKYVFVHRKNYIIFEYSNETRNDFYFEENPISKELTLYDFDKNKTVISYDYSAKDSIFRLGLNNQTIISKALNWRELPIFEENFHYTIDEIK